MHCNTNRQKHISTCSVKRFSPCKHTIIIPITSSYCINSIHGTRVCDCIGYAMQTLYQYMLVYTYNIICLYIYVCHYAFQPAKRTKQAAAMAEYTSLDLLKCFVHFEMSYKRLLGATQPPNIPKIHKYSQTLSSNIIHYEFSFVCASLKCEYFGIIASRSYLCRSIPLPPNHPVQCHSDVLRIYIPHSTLYCAVSTRSMKIVCTFRYG